MQGRRSPWLWNDAELSSPDSFHVVISVQRVLTGKGYVVRRFNGIWRGD
jgi:hypothetical protein